MSEPIRSSPVFCLVQLIHDAWESRHDSTKEALSEVEIDRGSLEEMQERLRRRVTNHGFFGGFRGYLIRLV